MKSLLFCCLWLVSTAAMAQTNKNWQDTLLNRTRLLRELVQEQNFEDAQMEAGELRAFLHRNYIHYPPAVLGLISGIYLHNKDRKSGLLLLGEAEQDAKRDKNPATQAALLTAIIKEHDRWGNDERANVCRGILQTVQDSLAARQLAQHTHHFEKK